jgi:hypothetical protein
LNFTGLAVANGQEFQTIPADLSTSYIFAGLAGDHGALKRRKDRLAPGQTEPNILISGGSDGECQRGNLHFGHLAPTGFAFQLDPPSHRAALLCS